MAVVKTASRLSSRAAVVVGVWDSPTMSRGEPVAKPEYKLAKLALVLRRLSRSSGREWDAVGTTAWPRQAGVERHHP